MPRWLLGCVLLLTSTVFARADEAIVRVELASGRSFQGAIDSRTTREQLWLRFRVGSVQLQRPIVWSRIESAQLNGEPIEIEELQARG